MELSSSLLKSFAKTTNDSASTNDATTVYGTVVASGGKRYVILDGSSTMTSVVEAADSRDGDRVIVTIQNHVATITNNLSNPSSGYTASETEALVAAYYADFQSLEAYFADITYLEAYSTMSEYLEAKYATLTQLQADYITAEQISANYATLTQLQTDYLTATQISATYATLTELQTDYLTANQISATYATLTELQTDYLTAEQISATYATLSELDAKYAEIEEAIIDEATIRKMIVSYGYITLAEIEDLSADVATIKNAYISAAEVNTLLANYASVTELDAATANIDVLDASVASITSLLAGSAGVGTLEAIHLTSDNVVIEDAIITSAMIVDVTADKITSGTIYTDLVKIANNEGENLLIDGATIQLNDGTYVRVQIGKDASGDYNMYIWNASGDLLWDALGLTEAGVSGNGGIIRDVAVAEDAAISGYKLDISSVAECLNADGSLTVNAAQVKIDETTLDYKLTSITQQVDASIIYTTSEFYLSTSATELSGGTWSAEQPTWTDGMYIWARTLSTYADGTTEYSTAVCITGNTGAQGEDGSDGEDGERGTSILQITTAPSSYTTTVGGYTPTYRVALSTVISQSGAEEVLVGDSLLYSYYVYPVGYVDSSYAYCGTRTSIRGATGATGATGAAGAAGADGEDGVGISSIVNYYLRSSSSSGVTTSTSGWTTTIQTITTTYKYLWNYEVVTYTDGNTYTSTPCIIGVYGNTGATGATGAAGADGADGERGTSILKITTAPSSYTTTTGGYTPTYRIALSTVISQASVDEVLVGDSLLYSYYVYPVGYVDSSYVYCGTRTSIRGAQGATGATGVGVSAVTAYYATGSSGTTKPSSPSTSTWSTTTPTVGSTEYLWVAYLVTYTDSTTEWTEPYCVTDASTRERVTTLETDLTVVQGQITSKVWQTDIDTVESELVALSDKYTTTAETVSGLVTEVGDLTTTVSSNYSTLSSRVTTVETTANGLTSTVSNLSTTVSNNYTELTAADTKYGTCSTAAATTAKVVTCSTFTTLSAGATICVYFTYANTAASPTLNVNSTGAKSIYAYGAAIASGSDYNWTAKSYVTFVYNGSQWCMVDSASSSKISQLADSITLSVGSSSGGKATIALSVDGSDAGSGSVVTSARTAFASESSAITISAGTITFNSNTLAVNSSQFTLDSSGNATFSGTLSAASGSFSGELVAATGTFAGELSAATGTFSGTLSGVDGTFSGTLEAATGSFEGEITASSITALNSYYIHNSSGTKARALYSADGSVGTTLMVGDGFSSIYLEGYVYTAGDLSIYEDGSGALSCGAIECSSVKASTIRSNSGVEIFHSSTPFIDFHYANSTADYTSRIYETSSGTLTITGSLAIKSALTVTSTITASGGVIGNINSTSYGNGHRWTTSFGTIGIQTLSNGSGLYLYTQASDVSSWSSSVLLADTTGVTVIRRSNGAEGVGSSTVPVYISSSGVATACYPNALYYSGTGYVWVGSGTFRPTSSAGDATLNCGNGTYRWNKLYASSSTVQTSDIREKENVVNIDERYEQLFMLLRGVNYTWRNYRPNDNHDRIHCGLIAQEVEAACTEVGLDSMSFATLCWDELAEPTYDGRTERYSLAYGELHGLEIHMIQKNVRSIETMSDRISDLETKIQSLTEQLNELKASA